MRAKKNKANDFQKEILNEDNHEINKSWVVDWYSNLKVIPPFLLISFPSDDEYITFSIYDNQDKLKLPKYATVISYLHEPARFEKLVKWYFDKFVNIIYKQLEKNK